MSVSCSEATVFTFSTPDGKHWELFQGGEFSLLNQIPSISQATQTAPHVVMRNAGLCSHSPAPTQPNQKIGETNLFTEISPYQANLARLQIQRAENSGLAGGEGFGWVGVIGVGLVLLTQGEKVVNRRATRSVDAQIATEARALVAAGHVTAETIGTPTLEANELALSSPELAPNSQWPQRSSGLLTTSTSPSKMVSLIALRSTSIKTASTPKATTLSSKSGGLAPVVLTPIKRP